MRFQEMIETVDTHTGGEPTRIILSGIPKLEGNSVREKRDYFKEHYDYIRTRLTYEPRGHAGMLCAAVVPPTMPEADFGIFYMDDVQYLDMCGHASIGVGTALQEIGLVPKAHRDRYAIETPAGLVWIKNNFKEDYVYSTTVRNVNSYVIENELRIDVDDVKDVPVNLAYGGNVFAIVPAARFGIKIQPSYMERIKHYSARIREVIAEKGIAVTLVQWYDEPKSKEADLRVVHSSGYGSPDRSPGGTGTSVMGLASVIIGTKVFARFGKLKATTAVILGTIVYKACVSAAMAVGFKTLYLKLITSAFFLVILVVSENGKKKVR